MQYPELEASTQITAVQFKRTSRFFIMIVIFNTLHEILSFSLTIYVHHFKT